nr:immunoglobulin heavy chain junction region [Mus musculus]
CARDGYYEAWFIYW